MSISHIFARRSPPPAPFAQRAEVAGLGQLEPCCGHGTVVHTENGSMVMTNTMVSREQKR